MFLLSFLQKIFEICLKIPMGGGELFNITLSYLASFCRFFTGSIAASNVVQCSRPRKHLILYQYEGCPYCRKVRECISTLGLDVIIYPCPRVTLSKYGVSDSSRFRPIATKLSGHCMFPLLVDENVSPKLVLLESSDIVSYLWKTYGNVAQAPWNSWLANFSIFKYFLVLPTLFRSLPEMGILRLPSNPPPSQMIELYGYETCPRTRLVRELLDSLELPYLYHNTPPHNNLRGVEKMQLRYQELQKNRKDSPSLSCHMPLFIDQLHDVVATNPFQILAHLRKVYQKEGSIVESNWTEYSTEGASERHGVVAGYSKAKKKN
jgi:arsenate reductase-like glutaredoxin family protein